MASHTNVSSSEGGPRCWHIYVVPIDAFYIYLTHHRVTVASHTSLRTAVTLAISPRTYFRPTVVLKPCPWPPYQIHFINIRPVSFNPFSSDRLHLLHMCRSFPGSWFPLQLRQSPFQSA